MIAIMKDDFDFFCQRCIGKGNLNVCVRVSVFNTAAISKKI